MSTDVLLDLLANLPGHELYSTLNLVCRLWKAVIEKNSALLPKKLLEGQFDLNYAHVIKCLTPKLPSLHQQKFPIEKIPMFWNLKYIVENLHISNYSYCFYVPKEMRKTMPKPMMVKSLHIQNGYKPAANFLDEYEDLVRNIRPKHIKWNNEYSKLSNLRFLKKSRFFQLKSIETLEVFIKVDRENPFEEMGVDELVNFIENADGNTNSRKESIKIEWNKARAPNFVEKLIQKFMVSLEPDQFFREMTFFNASRHSSARWLGHFVTQGKLVTAMNGLNYYEHEPRMVYEFSRKDGWNLGLNIEFTTSDNIILHVYRDQEEKLQ